LETGVKMETRRLSPDELWIEAPFERHTCLLLWHAMAGCGLRNGAIDWREGEDHAIVEGHISKTISSDRAVFQMQLRPDEGGTRIVFFSMRRDGQFDFGENTRVRGGLSLNIEKFLRQSSLETRLPEPLPAPVRAPIASPVGGEKLVKRNEAEHKKLLPLQPIPLWQQVAPLIYFVFGMGALFLPIVFGPLNLGTAVLLWSGRTRGERLKSQPFVFLALGILGCLLLFTNSL